MSNDSQERGSREPAPRSHRPGYRKGNRPTDTPGRRDAALTGDERRYRVLAEMCPGAVLVCQDDRVVFANSAAQSLLGASSSRQLLGRNITDLVAERSQAGLLRPGEDSPARLTRHTLVRLDSRPVDVEATSVVVQWAGREAVHMLACDVAAHKRTEHALREN